VPLAQVGIETKLFENMAKIGNSTASAVTLAEDAKVDSSLMSMAIAIKDVMSSY